MAASAFMILYLILSFLIIVNMYIAVILENYSQVLSFFLSSVFIGNSWEWEGKGMFILNCTQFSILQNNRQSFLFSSGK